MLRRTQAELGGNLVRGFWNFVEDWERAVNGRKPLGTEAFRVGIEVAATPGKVVFSNRLIELIQYAPTTDKVRSGADPDRAGLDHEVLYPRSVAGRTRWCAISSSRGSRYS